MLDQVRAGAAARSRCCADRCLPPRDLERGSLRWRWGQGHRLTRSAFCLAGFYSLSPLRRENKWENGEEPLKTNGFARLLEHP